MAKLKTPQPETKAPSAPAEGQAPVVTATETKPSEVKSSEKSNGVASVTVSNIRTSESPESELVDIRLIKILVKYPTDYKGKKMLVNDKEYDVSQETADILVGKGIAEKL
jgi:hypothetical protein